MRKIYKVWLTLWTFAPISSDTTVNIHIQTYRDFFFFGSIHFSDNWIQMCEFANVGSGLKNQTNWQRSSVCAHPNQTYQHFIRYGGDLFFFCVQWFHNHSTKWRCGCTSEEEEQQIQKAGSFPNVAAVTHIWVWAHLFYSKHGKFPNWKNLTWERVSVASFTCPEEDSVSSRLVIFRALQCIQSPLLHSTEDTNIQY